VFNVECTQDKVADIIAQLHNIRSSPIDVTILNSVRKQIIAEQNQLIDYPNEVAILDHVHAISYQNSRLANAPLGNPEVVGSATPSSLEEFRDGAYQHAVLAVASSLGRGAVEGAAKKIFDATWKVDRPELNLQAADFVGSQMIFRDETKHECQLAFAYDLSGASIYPLKVLQQLVGDWNLHSNSNGNFASSDLAELLANENLVDKYYAFLFNYPLAQTFGIYAKSHSTHKIDDVAYEIFNVYQKMISSIPPHDLLRAKHQVINKFLASVSTPTGLLTKVTNEIVTYGEPNSVDDFVQKNIKCLA